MDRSISVRTPESIAFSYELAGAGSRFLALAVDTAIQTVLLIAAFAGISWALSQVSVSRERIGFSTSIGIAIAVTILFAVYFGYFIAFEALWNGQTPGKRLLGLRVVRDGGYPIDFGAAAIRNLVRVGEAAFGFYAISVASTLLSPLNKRLGDLAAGTIVVRDERTATLESIVAKTQTVSAPLGAIPDRDRILIDRFMTRRGGLARNVRALLAYRLADRVRPHVPADLRKLDDEDLLERVSGS